MFRLHYILSIILLAFIIYSRCYPAHDVNNIASINNYSGDGIYIFTASSGSYGISSFEVISEDKIALLCSSEREIKFLDRSSSQIIRQFSMNFFPEDFTYASSSFFVLSDYSIHQFDETGKEQNELKINENFRFIDRLKTVNNSLYVLTSDGSSYKVIDNGNYILPVNQPQSVIPGWIIDENTSISTSRIDDTKFALNIYNGSKILKENVITVNKKLGSAIIIGTTKDAAYIDVQCILQEVPLETQRIIYTYSFINESIIDTFQVPGNYQYYTKHDFCVYNNSLFKLISLQDRTDFLKFTYNNNNSKTIIPKEDLRIYHYNNFLPIEFESQPISFKKENEQLITRSQILAIADRYEKIAWHCSDKNTTNHTIVRLPDGATIRTPEWVTPGDKLKMPYKWGGFTNVDIYNARIEAGSYAGDDYTSREQNVVSVGDTYCVGVDCSGFVSLVWGRTQREWTGSLPNISTQLESWSQVQPGDIANKSGSHTMLFVSRNPSGTFNIIHSSGYDWRVSYKTINLNDLSGYVPLKYKNVEEITSVNNNVDNSITGYQLLQNYPNPFNPETVINYQLPAACHVELKVFNILGREVAMLVNQEQNTGNYKVKFNGSRLASGVYLIRFQTGNISITKKMMLIK